MFTFDLCTRVLVGAGEGKGGGRRQVEGLAARGMRENASLKLSRSPVAGVDLCRPCQRQPVVKLQ